MVALCCTYCRVEGDDRTSSSKINSLLFSSGFHLPRFCLCFIVWELLKLWVCASISCVTHTSVHISYQAHSRFSPRSQAYPDICSSVCVDNNTWKWKSGEVFCFRVLLSMQNKEQKNRVGLATRVAAFDVTCTSKLEFGHAATIQEFDWDNPQKKDHLLVVHNT